MKTPSKQADEQVRLEALRSYEILDTLPEDAYDELADLAATLCEVPMALVTFVDEDRQWTKACVGLDRDPVDREISFCGHVVADGEPMVVEDTLEDERFRDNPLVTDDPGLRFYAGVPITSPNGHALGTVCALDREPRELSADRLAGLEAIASQVTRLLETRSESLGRAAESRFFQAILDGLTEHVAIVDGEGTIVATNEAWDALAREHDASVEPGESFLAPVRGVEDGDAQHAREGVEALLAGEQAAFEMEYPCKGPDEKRWFRMTATAFEDRGEPYVVVAHHDVTEATRARRQQERLVEELAYRDEILETLAESLPQILWLVGADLEQTVFQSPGAHRFWGLATEELQQDPMAWTQLVHEDDREELETWVEEDLAGLGADPQASPELAFRFRHGDTREVRWALVKATGIHEDGELVQVAGTTEDVTERKRREAERGRLRQIVETSPEGVGVARPSGEVLYLNDRFLELMGFDPGRPVDDLTIADFHPPDLLEEIRSDWIPEAIETGSWQGESQLQTLEGERIPVLQTITAHEDDAGEVTHVSTIVRDIRPQKRARRAVEESERLFRNLAEHIDEVFWIRDADQSEVLYVSPAYEETWGRDPEELYADAHEWMEAIHPEDRPRVEEAFPAQTEGDYDVEYRVRRPDGEIRWIRDRAFPVRDEHGDLERIVGVATDVTQARRDREREARRARQDARLEELEQLVFATSHTLKTEVRRIRSFGQLLNNRVQAGRTGELDEPVREMLEGSGRLQELHEGLREYAEVTKGRGAFERVDLSSLVREVLAERSPSVEDGGGRAELGELPPVRGDPEQLRQLFAELVDNAVKFAGEEPVHLDVTARTQGDHVEVEVADRGIGFDARYAEKVFGIFQQLDPHRTEGVGIGLTIARRIAENHRGGIRIHAEPGQGAAVTVRLPVEQADDGARAP